MEQGYSRSRSSKYSVCVRDTVSKQQAKVCASTQSRLGVALVTMLWLTWFAAGREPLNTVELHATRKSSVLLPVRLVQSGYVCWRPSAPWLTMSLSAPALLRQHYCAGLDSASVHLKAGRGLLRESA